jgi:hypothetical protein
MYGIITLLCIGCFAYGSQQRKQWKDAKAMIAARELVRQRHSLSTPR